MTANSTGVGGESGVQVLLNRYGHKTRCLNKGESDFLVDDKYLVEVKTAKARTYQDTLMWKFNIHRHGELPAHEPDCYILRLEEVPHSAVAIHLLYKSISVKGVYIGMRGLLNQRYHKEVAAFYDFCKNGHL